MSKTMIRRVEPRSPAAKAGVNIGVRDTFADIAATILTFFGMDNPLQGTSFYQQIVGEAL